MLLYIKVNGDKSALSRRKADKGLAHIYLYDGDTLVTGPDGKRSGLPERRPPSSHRWRFPAPEHRTSPRGCSTTWSGMELLQYAAGGTCIFCCLFAGMRTLSFPIHLSTRGRSAVPPAAGSAPRRQSAVLLNRCAWDSPLSFALNDPAQVPHPVRFFSVLFRWLYYSTLFVKCQ